MNFAVSARIASVVCLAHVERCWKIERGIDELRVSIKPISVVFSLISCKLCKIAKSVQQV